MANGNSELAIELARMSADFAKHLTTIAAGIIVIMATLMEKLFKTPEWKMLAVVSVSCLLLTILACCLIYVALLFGGGVTQRGKLLDAIATMGAAATGIAVASFSVGMVCLGLFTIKNFL